MKLAFRDAPWLSIVAGIVLSVLAIKLIQANDATKDWKSRAASAAAKLAVADSLVRLSREQDVADSVQRVRDQFIMDSLGGVITFQMRTIARWERTVTTLHPVDTTQAVAVQLVHCQENVAVLLRDGAALAQSLEVATQAGLSAIATATAANARADSADARRAIVSDSVQTLLQGATKALRRPWYAKLWGGTKQVVTSVGLIGVGVVAGKLL